MADGAFDLLAVDVFTWTPHLATTVEVCLRHAEMGQRVGFVFLDIDNIDELAPRVVPETALWRWYGPMLRGSRRADVRTVETILRDNGVTVIRSPHPVRMTKVSSAELALNSIDALRSFRYEGAALGLGVLSSVIRHHVDPSPDFDETRRLTDHLLNSAITAFDLTRQLIQRYQPKAVLVYNGRLACSKAIAEAARISGAELRYHEIGATHERFYLSDRPVQSVANARTMMLETWAAAGEDREEIAARFFTRGRGGAPLIFTEFYRDQDPGQSVQRSGVRRIVYFVSSDDEHAAVEDGVEHPLFDSQRAAVLWLIDWVRARPAMELVIRVHPRMRTSSPREQAWWDGLAGANVTTVRADSPVDSYALAADADVVVCYRSTMGPEATYLGRPAIAVGGAVYRGLDCVYEPRTIAELESMLDTPDLAPKARENCLPFGYLRMMRGTPYRFYQPESVRAGSFFGVPLPAGRSFLRDRVGLRLFVAASKRIHPRAGRAGRPSR